jgi:FixJ family two-component response regulator
VVKDVLISIVDDDESVRESTMDLVGAVGLRAEAFPSAEDFLKSKRFRGCSCLIADVQMPGMTGLELHAALAALGVSIPTILITAYPDDRIRARALRAGILCYLIKPFSETEFLTCVRLAIEHSKTNGSPT